jgi:hypothetical protein
MPLYLQKIFCTTESAWVYLWSASVEQPTTCPHNAEHEVTGSRQESSLFSALSITDANSPFTCPANAFIGVDTTAADVEVTLPSATDYDDGSFVVIAKTLGENSLIVVAEDNETVEGEESITLTEPYAMCMVEASGSAWIAMPMSSVLRLAGEHDASTAALTSASSLKEWEFQYVLPNARNNSKAVMGGWHTLSLNTTVADGGSDILRSGSTITLQPGRYRATGGQTFYKTERTSVRLYNVTDAVTIGVSPALYWPAFASIDTAFVIAGAAKVLRLEYRIGGSGRDAGSPDELEDGNRTIRHGLGKATGFGEVETYTILRLVRTL